MPAHEGEDGGGADDGRLFAGVRFALVGFDPVSESQYRSEMVQHGGVDAGAYGAACTHLIVFGLVYDNPICVAARKDGKKVVSEQWVEDSLDLGEMADADRVQYRPVRDFSGIPGSESLCICLTGYQKNKRQEIMNMASLMGAQFSKNLTHSVTHLICYKFEGLKYETAKQENINLVNHQWMEDCLMAWKILPVGAYTKSSWELEIMTALVKDSEDEEETGRSSSGSKRPTRSAWTADTRMTDLIGPDSQATTRDPTVSSSNAEIAAGGHMSTSEQMKNAGGSSNRSLNIKPDLQNTPIFPDPDVHESAHLPLNGKEETPAAQVHSDEAKDDVTPGAHCISNIGGTAVCSDHYVHQSTMAPAILVDNTEIIIENCLDSINQNNVNNALWSTPSKETLSEKTLQSSDLSGNAGQKDGGSTPDLNAAVDQSNAGQKLTLHEANLRFSGNAASKNTQVLSYKRRRCRKYVSPEANLKPTGPPQSFERITPRVEFNISPSMNIDHKNSDLTDSGSLRVDEVAKKVDKSSGALAQRRTSKLSSISIKPSVSSETGIANSPFSSRESASEATTISDLIGNSTQSVILTKENSGTRKSNLLSHRRTLKLARPVEGEQLSENSSKANKPLRGNTLVLHEARSEKDYAAKSSANSEVEKRNSSSSLQTGDTEMSDAPQVNTTEVVAAPNKEFENVVSHQNMEVVTKEIQVSAIISECEPFPQEEPNSKVKNTSGKRFWNASKKAATKYIKNKDEVLSFKSDGDKVVSRQNVEAQSEKNCASPNGVECAVIIPEQVPSSGANSAAAKNLLHASQMNAALALSKTELAEKYTEENPGSASSDSRRKSSFLKVSQTADVEMPDAPIVDSMGAMSSKSGCKKVFTPENVGSSPKRLSSNTNTGGPETCTPSVVPNNRVRKAAAKRKVSAVQQNSFGAEHCKNGSAFVSEFKFVYSKRASGSSRNGSKKATDQNLQSSNEDVTKDTGGSFSKDAMRDRLKIVQNSQARSSKRHKSADLLNSSTDYDKENLPVNRNIIPNSKCGNSGMSSNCFIEAAGSGKDLLTDHGVVEENDCGMLTVLEPRLFILSGHRLLRKEYKSILRPLKGRVCRDSHHWSFQATHFITPELRRTEKFFAAAAAGRWILKSDYLTACNDAGKFLEEEPFEWHGDGLNNSDTISMDAPRKWRQLRQHTGHGAFYGMEIIIYGECISPSLDTLKRAVRAGDGTILATAPPYTRFLKPDVDFAVVSPGMPSADAWVQEFMRQGIPCISADYLVEYVCKPGHSLDKHVLFNMHHLADKSHAKLLKLKGQQHDDVLAAGAGEAADAFLLVDPTTGKD
uniref:BRCT domain-containing protein n=1 Tax=Leersia perrieri TaxID=77586 RepID=A0A0D9X367_9ORYZ